MSGYFGKKPGFRVQPLTLSQIFTAFLASARTFLGTVTITKTAEAGVAETLQVWKLSDDATAKVELVNASATDGVFIPRVLGSVAGANTAYQIYGLCASDTGSNPALLFDGRTSSSTALSTRPIAGWANAATRVMTLWPTGLYIGTSTSSVPAASLEVRGTGSQFAFGNGADLGFAGANSSIGAHLSYGAVYDGTNYKARQTSATTLQMSLSSFLFRLVSGATVGNNITWNDVATLNATGFGVNCTPGYKFEVRDTSSQIAYGIGANQAFLFGHSTGNYVSYAANWNGTGWVARGTDAAIYAIRTTDHVWYVNSSLTSGNTFTQTQQMALSATGLSVGAIAAGVKLDVDGAMRAKSYTLATLPTVASNTRGLVWCSDHTGGARYVYSDGTNWRDVRTGNVAA